MDYRLTLLGIPVLAMLSRCPMRGYSMVVNGCAT